MSTYIIAEAGVNHNGDPKLAVELVDVAADAGADAVKFQTFVPEEEISAAAPKADYQLRSTNAQESQLDMVRRLKLRDQDFIDIADRCNRRGITFLSSPSDERSINFLVDVLGVQALKLPSGEVTNGPYLLAAARKRRKMILSTGMSQLSEVELALSVLAFGLTHADMTPEVGAFAQAFQSDAGQTALWQHVSVLHCTTEYPTPFSDVNLRAMDTLRDAFHLPVGLSDHTSGIAVALAAVGRGATVIEKHFTIAKTLPGPDHQASLEPAELNALVAGIRQIDAAMGDGAKVPQTSEIKNIPVARRSLVARRPIRSGEIFTPQNLCAKRPGNGISPMQFWDRIGRPAARDYAADELI